MRSTATISLIVICIFLIPLTDLGAVEMRPVPAPPIIGAKSYFVVDGNTGHEMASLEPDKALAPASLTKLMTAYTIFRALRENQIALDDQVTVSEKAWRTPGSRMFIEVGSRVTVQDLLLGMIVQSGNDASVALAEHVAGTESVFVKVMNQYAATLGMHSKRCRILIHHLDKNSMRQRLACIPVISKTRPVCPANSTFRLREIFRPLRAQ